MFAQPGLLFLLTGLRSCHFLLTLSLSNTTYVTLGVCRPLSFIFSKSPSIFYINQNCVSGRPKFREEIIIYFYIFQGLGVRSLGLKVVFILFSVSKHLMIDLKEKYLKLFLTPI